MPNVGARSVVIVLVAAAAFVAGYLLGRSERDDATPAAPRSTAPRAAEQPARSESRSSVPPRHRSEPETQKDAEPDRVLPPGSPDLVEPSGELTGLDPIVVPDRTVSVRGRCVDRAGQPLGGIRVFGPRGVPTARTDADGRFRLERTAESGAYVRFFPDWRPLAAARVDLPAASDGVVDLGDVVLETGDVLRGRFLDAAGNPIAGAKAHLVSRELEGTLVGAVAVTDADGRFVVEHVGPGTYDLGLLRPGFDLDGGDLTNIVYGVRASEEVIVRAMRDHYVHVQFLDEQGEVVKFRGGRVTWFAMDDTSDRLDWWGLGGDWDHFHIAARPGATYEVRIELDGFEPATIRATATDARDTRAEAVLRRKLR